MTSRSNTNKSLLYMSLLALQFGIQPILTRRFTPPGIIRSTVILAQEFTKMIMAGAMLYLTTGGKPLETALRGWTVGNWVQVAGVPAALYAVQNICALQAYQNLDALTFNVLNQTKTLSAALCCYWLLGKPQSRIQMLALFLLLVAALIMEKIVRIQDLYKYYEYCYAWGTGSILTNATTTATATATATAAATTTTTAITTTTTANEGEGEGESETSTTSWDTARFTLGVAPILLASFISGLAGALSQRNLQSSATGGGRNPYLFSMELCVATVLILTASFLVSPDGTVIVQHGFFHAWTWPTWIPILTNSLGGIVVGLVTKYAGSVRKGFALIFGILLSGLVQAGLQPEIGVSSEQVVGGLLAGISLYLHAQYPPASPKPTMPTPHKTVKLE